MTNKYGDVNASPTKAFFVSMLTRDISLTDAVLDLLDNCVDGILRSSTRLKTKNPYEGFFADINFDKGTFSIHDNCGGIPWKLKDRAFRMGRPPKAKPEKAGTVGTYGIGMKRAIFKIGRECILSTKSGNDHYDVEITAKWLEDENTWDIPVNPSAKPMIDDGTFIVIGNLHENISLQFGHDRASFIDELGEKIATHYSFIMEKGFVIRLCGDELEKRKTSFLVSGDKKSGIAPYIYKANSDDVEISLAVGFTRAIPSEDDIEKEKEGKQYSSEDAGWTIICNDRAVVYCDRTELTGWGEAGVPRYHTQFIAITGIVEFKSKFPAKLPTTTTKRGIDASSTLFLQVKNRMREGMKHFTDYTNKWKKDLETSKAHMNEAKAHTFQDVLKMAEGLELKQAKKGIGGEYHIPSLPKPQEMGPTRRRISFVKPLDEIRTVAAYLFEDPDSKPSEVGERCFSEILEAAEE